jgi:flagellar hook-associated protein 3 FlgL
MRVAGTSYTNSMATQINQLAAKQYQLQNQATTGQSITAPEDDPAGIAQALGLQTDASNVAQYAKSISTLQSHSNLVADALSRLKTISDKVSEIAVGSDDTSKTEELQANAATTTQLIQQAVDVMNSKDGDQYIFGGTASGQPPFAITKDASGNVTGVAYQGNQTVTDNEIGVNSTITVDAPGENNTGTGLRGVVSDSRYGADFFNHMISLQNHLLSGDTASIHTTDDPNLTKDSDNIVFQVSNNGAALSRLDLAASAATTKQSALSASLNSVAGADLAQTLTQLTQAQNAYQIALQSSSSIMQLRSTLLANLP